MIEVPCAGAVAGSDLLNAFEAGAEGVMLCTCHTGNCQSEVGNQVARKRAGSTRKLLQAGGMQAEKLRVTSVAANMGLEFAYQMNAFAEDIKQLNTPSKENQNG
jgi:F420-non-reducing hydrogenase iron-sulfur subunit